ncbi:LysM peptidoglycan-binding domain-containing protein [Mobilitalea sibirica]|uniref:LysM peptidoglycan-binding domain-containing protein n=1 Tax=Mobilitalea sibirica TaxID=1462919 RepID=A0A8J7KU20_9FIRM|nr:LysM peptidoglycan-binding domain-containing protein [Mobilitalea sibirica]MBH1941976.1 LysM peptidoglycan-binding domain-containing protein [Mobilitalea sibirica]
MIIHVVRPGDTIQSIADQYDISVMRLIQDNGLENLRDLVIGQSIVIAFPVQTYTVQEGDTLQDIATAFDVSIMQLYRNNPHLTDREYIYPGETIVIKYNNTKGNIMIHGNTFPFINENTFRKTLPYLTYLSIINYTATDEGDIITHYDETDMIGVAREYGVMPLMLITTLSIRGEANIGIAYDILINEEFQNRLIDNILAILKEKGYFGVNLAFQYLNISNLRLYESYLTKINKRLTQEGYVVFVTINPIREIDDVLRYERVDYSQINQLTDYIVFMNNERVMDMLPPSPIISVSNIEEFIDFIDRYVTPDKIMLGIPSIGQDWQLPFVAGFSDVNTLIYANVIQLASNVGASIEFDEMSQTPYFTYTVINYGRPIEHIVWFVDARTIDALLNLQLEYNLPGIDYWNIMMFNPQFWLIINSQYEILKNMNLYREEEDMS